MAVLMIRTTAQTLAPPLMFSYVSQRDNANWDIHLVDAARRTDVNLTQPHFDGNARSRVPVWSPDGNRLAFVSDNGGQNHIYLYEVIERRLRQLTDDSYFYSSLSWSPDGTQLVASATLSTPAGVRLFDVDSGEERVLTAPTAPVLYAQFSPTGRQILYMTVQEQAATRTLHIYDVTTGSTQEVAQGSFRLVSPVWSPDGQYVAYIDITPQDSTRLYLHIRDVTSDRRLSWQQGLAALGRTVMLDWGEEQIAVSLGTDMLLLRDVQAYLDDEINRMPARFATDGSLAGFKSEPEWSPEGSWLAFAFATRNTQSEIYLMQPDGDPPRRMTFNNINDWAPAWRVVP